MLVGQGYSVVLGAQLKEVGERPWANTPPWLLQAPFRERVQARWEISVSNRVMGPPVAEQPLPCIPDTLPCLQRCEMSG